MSTLVFGSPLDPGNNGRNWTTEGWMIEVVQVGGICVGKVFWLVEH